MVKLSAPFPWFGGKSRVADIVWQRFGAVANYVEPFFGSGAVLFGKPDGIDCIETVNDKDAYVSNFWRAIKRVPDEVAEWADEPVNENDLHARHIWLVERKEDLRLRVEGDPDYCDARVAGYWVWGVCCWIAHGFCSGRGPWGLDDERRLVRLGDTVDRGINRQLIHLGDTVDRGINRQLIHLGNAGRGINRKSIDIYDWFALLSNRLRRVRVCSGDWRRVVGNSPTINLGLTGVFFDPPYTSKAGRDSDLYLVEDLDVGRDVFEWAMKNGDNSKLRIALCGYEGEYEFPDSWQVVRWNAKGGYAHTTAEGSNATKERIWFSPHCLNSDENPQMPLF